MKTILMPVSNSFAVRNFLRAGFPARAAERGARLVLLAPPEKLPYYESQLRFPNVSWGILPPVAQSRIERVFTFCEHSSLPTRTVYLMHQFYLHRRGTKTPFPIRIVGFLFRMALWLLGHFRWYRALFRFAYSLIPNRAFSAVLSEYKPDAVFCPTLIYGGEYALLKEAKQSGISTVGLPSSWDNFTSKTFLRVQPNRLLVQTDIMKRDAARFGDFPVERISVVGAPQYDGHFRREGLVLREEFFQTIGGASDKKLILFAFSGKTSATADWEVLAVLADAFRTGALSRKDVQVLVRPYPKRKFSMPEFALVRSGFGFLIESPVERVGSGKNAWEFDERALALLRNSIAHADVAITACSTFLVEAAIFDKPLIAIAFGPKGADYWNSAQRFFLWNHLADIGKTGGVVRAENGVEFVRVIREYLADSSLHTAGRRRIVVEQAVFTDGASIERIVMLLM